jgi:N-hydroxyarylamine O-acetyltransferase
MRSMDVPAIDLDAYFRRIEHTGPRTPTLETLQQIHLRHTCAIPFENLDPFMGWPVRLDAQSLQQKLIAEGRGGYCFEHNILFSHALRGVGFDVTWLAARVLANQTPGSATARTHMLLLVTLGPDRYVADAGFGGLTLTGPLRLEADVEQTTPHEPFRLVAADDDFVMEASFGGSWNALYRFGLQEQLLADYELTNWYLSNHPESRFVTGLMAARPDADRRYALRDNALSIHHRDGRTEQRLLTARELEDALRTLFRIRLPRTPALTDALQRLAARNAAAAGTM